MKQRERASRRRPAAIRSDWPQNDKGTGTRTQTDAERDGEKASETETRTDTDSCPSRAGGVLVRPAFRRYRKLIGGGRTEHAAPVDSQAHKLLSKTLAHNFTELI